MPTLQEILDLLAQNAHDANDRLSELLHDDEVSGAGDMGQSEMQDADCYAWTQLPGRVVITVVESMNGLIDAVTGHGTLLANVPHIPLPSSSSSPSATSVLARRAATPAVPPTFFQRASRHIKSHVYIYSFLGGSTLTVIATTMVAHYFPAFRARLFGQMPFLKPVYLTATARLRRRPLPPIPRPRLTANGKGRLEAVLVLGADKGSQGREIAKRFEKKGFVVIATVQRQADIEDLEATGNGFIKGIVLDGYSVDGEARPFSADLNTALSLRYPLNSPGDPFAAPDAALQLVAVINCLPLSGRLTPSSSLPLPLEAMPAESLAESLSGVQATSLAVLQKVLPLFRTPKATARRDIPAPGIITTCYPSAQRHLGTPFSGHQGSALGLAAAGLAFAMDIMRRELALSARDAGIRPIKIVNVDVGFLASKEHSKPHRTHRGNDVGPREAASISDEEKPASYSAQEAKAALPRHLRETYGPALLAAAEDGDSARQNRRHMPPHHALADRLLHLVLAKKASHIPDRLSVGAGGKAELQSRLGGKAS